MIGTYEFGEKITHQVSTSWITTRNPRKLPGNRKYQIFEKLRAKKNNNETRSIVKENRWSRDVAVSFVAVKNCCVFVDGVNYSCSFLLSGNLIYMFLFGRSASYVTCTKWRAIIRRGIHHSSSSRIQKKPARHVDAAAAAAALLSHSSRNFQLDDPFLI